MGWQPIETAPVMQFVLVYRGDSCVGGCCVAYLGRAGQGMLWFDYHNNIVGYVTHWLYLPNLPEVQPTTPPSPLLWSHDVVE